MQETAIFSLSASGHSLVRLSLLTFGLRSKTAHELRIKKTLYAVNEDLNSIKNT